MDLDRILSKVRGLIQKSEHPSTPEDEAKACREKADQMMAQYAIEQAQLRESMPAAEQAKPGHIRIDVCGLASPYEQSIVTLVAAVAEFSRCSVIFQNLNWDKGTAIFYKRLKVGAEVFGFESDLRYFEILFTTLHLHMASGYDPKPDPALTDEENAYALHMAGLNWRAIARLYHPWHEYGWDGTHDEPNWQRYGAYWRSCYNREVKRRGEEPVVLPKFSDTDQNLIEYRINFTRSYVATVRERLSVIQGARPTGSEMVLVDSAQRIRDLMKEVFPETGPVEYERDFTHFNPEAWAAGGKHGQSADLGVSSRVSRPAKQELG